MGCSSLNIDGVSKRGVYFESGKHILQYGSEIFDSHDVATWI